MSSLHASNIHDRWARLRKPVSTNQLGHQPSSDEPLRKGDVLDSQIEPMSLTPPTSVTTSPAIQPRTVEHDGLCVPAVGTRQRLAESKEQKKARKEKMMVATRIMLECMGEDPDRQGLAGTPERVARAMLFATKGFEENLWDVVNNAVFTEDSDDMVLIKNIEISSMCEHHLLPFTGKLHIGYIPNGRVLGLSKFARIAKMFARRLQIQERLTKQIAAAIQERVNDDHVFNARDDEVRPHTSRVPLISASFPKADARHSPTQSKIAQAIPEHQNEPSQQRVRSLV